MFPDQEIGRTANSILGLRINQNRIEGERHIDQEEYVKSILKRFNMDEHTTGGTPVVENRTSSTADYGENTALGIKTKIRLGKFVAANETSIIPRCLALKKEEGGAEMSACSGAA